MSYKTILTHLDTAESVTSRVQVAANLANRQNAHLIGVAPAGVAIVPGDIFVGAAPELYAEMQAELDGNARQAVAKFDSICQQIGVSSVESYAIGNVPDDTILLNARYCDLVVVSQADSDRHAPGTNRGFVEHVVMGAGKPVLVVPKAGNCVDMGKRVVFAWDGSREAARAASDAMPILAQADAVQVLVINPKSGSGFSHGPLPGADIAQTLARHQVNVEVQSVQTDLDVGDALLSQASDYGADVIVMGAYGHSRMREWIMGGVTRTVLSAMMVPVLMSH